MSRASTVKRFTPVPGSSYLKLRRMRSQTGQQAAGAGFLFGGLARDFAQRRFDERDLDAVGAKGALVLPQDAAFGAFHDFVEVVHAELLADDAHRQTADEFRLEAVGDEIACGGLADQLRGSPAIAAGRRGFETVRDEFGQLLEGAADDEENVARVDGVRLAALPVRWNSSAAWSCAWMSFWLRTGTSVSSMSLSRVVCTPRPLTSRPTICAGAAILSISSM
jgi:hypothetical protein